MPVFKREYANKMYTPTTYFWGRFLSNIILQLFYPISTVLITFYGLSVDESFENLLYFIAYAVILNLTMCAQGYWCGTLCSGEAAAQQVNTFMILLFMLTSGGLGNVDSFPTWIRWVSYISPQRYACEGFFYRMTEHIDNSAPNYQRD